MLQVLSSNNKIVFRDEEYLLADDTIIEMREQQSSGVSLNGLRNRNPSCILNGYRFLQRCNIGSQKGSRKLEEIPGLAVIVKNLHGILKVFNEPGVLSLDEVSLIADTLSLLEEHDNFPWAKMPFNAFKTLLDHPLKLVMQKRFCTVWPLEFAIKPYSNGDFYCDCLLARQRQPRLSTTLNLRPVVVYNKCVDCNKSFTELKAFQVHRKTCLMRKISFNSI